MGHNIFWTGDNDGGQLQLEDGTLITPALLGLEPSIAEGSAIEPASEEHTVTGADTVDEVDLTAALDALGVKVNVIIDALVAADLIELYEAP